MTVLMHQSSHESKFWIPWITFVQLILSTYSHLSAFTGTFRFKSCIYWIIRLKNGIASSHMLCVKGQVGKGTATKSAFWHANHKKILCLNPGLLYLRKQFSASTRHPYDIFDASSFCKLSLAALCNRCSYALLYDIFNTSQFCLASLQLPFAVLCDHRLHALWLSDYVRLTPTEGQGTFVPNQCWDDVYKMPCFWEIHLVFTHSKEKQEAGRSCRSWTMHLEWTRFRSWWFRSRRIRQR